MVIDESTAHAYMKRWLRVKPRITKPAHKSRKAWMKSFIGDMLHCCWVVRNRPLSKYRHQMLTMAHDDEITGYELWEVVLDSKKFDVENYPSGIILSPHAIARCMQAVKSVEQDAVMPVIITIFEAVGTLRDYLADREIELRDYEIYVGGFGMVAVQAMYNLTSNERQYLVKTYIPKDVLNPGKLAKVQQLQDGEILI